MSAISNLPYGETLDYWYEKLKGHEYRYRFLLTKLVEAFTFKSKSTTYNKYFEYTPFPNGKMHHLPIKPRLAIIVPIYAKSNKDVQDLSSLFLSIQNLEYPPDIVVLVDDNSPIDYPCPKHFLKINSQINSGPAKARNKGIEIALTKEMDVIAFTDADCILKKDWTKQIIFHFQQNRNCGLVSGNTISKDKHWFGIYHNINGTLNGRRFNNSDKLLYGTTANLAITSEVATSIRFNENFPNAAGEDIEFCFKANKAGFEINHNKKMVTFHHYGYTKNFLNSLSKFRNQFRKYGRGEKILLELIPEYYAYLNETEEIKAE